MCLILIAWRVHPDFPCVIAANRDEFFDRPSAPMAFWEDRPSLLAGRDLRAGGTWMGVTRTGRFAALTNFREAEAPLPQAPSRGALVSDFLNANCSPAEYWRSCDTQAYRGFNLICGDLGGELSHYSNRGGGEGQRLEAGIYGISNHLLDTPWPKVAQGKSELAQALLSLPADRKLFRLLRDDKIHDDADLPRTGVDLAWERLLSAAFVRSARYGTCSSTVLLLDGQGWLSADEQSFLAQGEASRRQRFRFRLSH